MCSTFSDYLGPASSYLPQSPSLFLLSAFPLGSPLESRVTGTLVHCSQSHVVVLMPMVEPFPHLCVAFRQSSVAIFPRCFFSWLSVLAEWTLFLTFSAISFSLYSSFLFFFISLRQPLLIHPDSAQMVPALPDFPQVSTRRFIAFPPQEFDPFPYYNA